MKLTILSLSFYLLTMANAAYSISSLNLELGSAQNSYNQVKIDGENGTLFNLRPALNSSDYYRVSFIHKFKSSSGVRFLYAPLKFSGEKKFSKDIFFNGELFPLNQKTEAQYQFNSYRATYFREIISQKNLLLRVGGYEGSSIGLTNIGDLLIYSKTLSDSEVMQSYNNKVFTYTNTPPTPEAYS